MVGTTIRTWSILVICMIGCGGKKVRPAQPFAFDPIPLLVWVDGDVQLEEEDMLSGCRAWDVKGIQCYLIDSKWQSDIQIYVDENDPCKKNKDGRRTLARAWKGGRIVFYRQCFLKKGKVDRHMVRAVATHEVGHQLGIWKHVKEECGDDAPEHPNGSKVCGEAVMNPLYEQGIFFVTEIDALAFDLRNRFIGVVEDRSFDTKDPDCVYRARP